MRKPNGYGGISKLSGNRRRPYVARVTETYTDEGVQVYKVLGYFKTQEEALEELAKYNKAKYDIDLKRLTFAELYEEWSDSHFKDISQSAINGYKTAYKKCKNIHNIRFADLRKTHLQKVIDNDCNTYSIRKSVRVLLNVLYTYAYDNDIVDKKYSKTIDIGKPVKVYEKKPFTPEEIQKLWDNVDNIDGVDTILIMINTCTRVTEMLTLETSKINLNERYGIGGIKTEAGKDRVIPISKKILPLVKARYNPDNKYLITNEEGKPYTYYQYKRYIWEPLMEQLEMEHTIHECKHTGATALSNAGVDSFTKKLILGHKTDADITDRYTHKRIEQLLEAIDKI